MAFKLFSLEYRDQGLETAMDCLRKEEKGEEEEEKDNKDKGKKKLFHPRDLSLLFFFL